jgi:predicted transposase YdaD
MRTDKQLYLIFEANPQWLFELIGLPSPGPCRFESISLKAIEQTADGVVIPEAVDEVVTVLEIQFQRDDNIYARVVMEMALVQQKMHGRKVQGVILFADPRLDPQTEPWCRVVAVHGLTETISRLAADHPSHPLVATFRPLLEEDLQKLEQQAAGCYNEIATSDLDERQRAVLLRVFVNWLEQRFVEKGKLEIEEMLIGQLPDLRETQSGKDLIAIGVKEGIDKGIEKGKRESLIELLEARFGPLDANLIEKIQSLAGLEVLAKHFTKALKIKSVDQLFADE